MSADKYPEITGMKPFSWSYTTDIFGGEHFPLGNVTHSEKTAGIFFITPSVIRKTDHFFNDTDTFDKGCKLIWTQ
jgi:hypothetical protein